MERPIGFQRTMTHRLLRARDRDRCPSGLSTNGSFAMESWSSLVLITRDSLAPAEQARSLLASGFSMTLTREPGCGLPTRRVVMKATSKAWRRLKVLRLLLETPAGDP